MIEIDLNDAVALIEEAHTAKNAKALRQTMVYGVGALIESESCAWTELTADIYRTKSSKVTAVDVNDVPVDVPASMQLFSQHAWQNPYVQHLVMTGEANALSISDLHKQSEFQALKLYRLFYKTVSVEDQLCIGFVENGIARGLSVNRASWGFEDYERSALSSIANSVFPFYRALSRLEDSEPTPQNLIEASINNLSIHSKTMGVTDREAELLMHVAYGLSNKQIAATCSITEGTVRKHLENAFRKLGVTNRVRAIVRSADIIRNVSGQ